MSGAGPDPRAKDIRSWDGSAGDLDRYLADRQALSHRLDEESLILSLGWSPSVCATHEAMLPWDNATADRWYRALPERYMTPDKLARPDWDHSHYPHDKNGRIGRVATRQRPETEEDRQAAADVRAALARCHDCGCEGSKS